MKCYLVKLAEFNQISPKCYKAVDYSGNEALIPASQFCGYAGQNGVYLTAWILERKNLQYSMKKPVDILDGGINGDIVTITKHTPAKLEAETGVVPDESLIR
jgi:hypothetical protein